jgi:hypothetical protein
MPQIEEFTKRNNIVLEHGWKVVLAKYVKQQLQRNDITVPDELIEKWVKLFNQINLTK